MYNSYRNENRNQSNNRRWFYHRRHLGRTVDHQGLYRSRQRSHQHRTWTRRDLEERRRHCSKTEEIGFGGKDPHGGSKWIANKIEKEDHFQKGRK